VSERRAARQKSPLPRRQAGVLLHPTSLPGPWGNGDLGAEAYHFIQFLEDAGFSMWQLLPLGPTNGGSPYQCFSAHAGNPQLISIEKLAEWGWLNGTVEPGKDDKSQLLRRAHAGFLERGSGEDKDAYGRFVHGNAHWLDDFALYSVLKVEFEQKAWTEWPAPLRDRLPLALAEAQTRFAAELEEIRFQQFAFYRQWHRLKAHAHRNGITLFGDMPIFVAHDSADVWSQRDYFLLDADGHPTVVAGVPPDYFSATGQRWGNPHYDWEAMEADGFKWWLRRMESQVDLFDLVRVDHFRGFEAYWEIPAEEKTAINGRWVRAPGDALFAALHERFDPMPVVAEDLGTITEEVHALRDKWALPGMKILQFAFDGGPGNPYLPHQHEVNSVVYTGTHDNDTTVGWYEGLNDGTRAYVLEYLGQPCQTMPWPLIITCYASVSRLAILPLQDLLGLDGEHRMNTPGTETGNWSWRFDWSMFPHDLAPKLRRMAEIYGRLNGA
jgi:4-alpha-glucanotransferase